MKCPNDQEEMEKGIIDGYGGVAGAWSPKPMGFSNMLSYSKGRHVIEAWRCKKCGKVELTTSA